MKKFLLILLLGAGIISAQSFTFTPDTTYIVQDSGFVQFDCTIENLSGRNLGLRAIRLENDMPQNWISSLCVGISCYPPETDTVAFVIAGGGSVHFSLDVTIWGESLGSGTWLIRIENSSDSSEFIEETFIATNNPSSLTTPSNSPDTFILQPAFPNPFNQSITIPFQLIYPSEKLILSVIDTGGRLVWQETLHHCQPGHYKLQWLGSDISGHTLPSGIYLYKLQSAKSILTRKITLLK
ncbi:MAG TPA: T9SS type A sorting domain-containing protein [Candidatus Marinimicrobia bacterium]|nr:T9SS type A sorting domain-containing protein [Candidatus Neomarinimicrobiota bacterium]